jgi:hypothetical protein
MSGISRRVCTIAHSVGSGQSATFHLRFLVGVCYTLVEPGEGELPECLVRHRYEASVLVRHVLRVLLVLAGEYDLCAAGRGGQPQPVVALM